MSAFAASSWAAVAAVAHQLEREAAGLDPPIACALRALARRLHAARLLARHLFTAADSPRSGPLPSPAQGDDACG
ncbi:MAG: hypothetical protein ABJE95_12480 [Byssovorax sp.]